jgi:hypothetical protein
MSEDLLRQLQFLEEGYAGQPLLVQRADLREINQIRSQLGMPLVDARLHEIGAAAPLEQAKPVSEAAKPVPEEPREYTEAREIYQAYLAKMEKLKPHQAYAEKVAEATSGPGQTPVRPLATMGTNGGPLLCDHCGKAILLEGGPYHGMTADVGWKMNLGADWNSWILGGMVVEIQTNGTLRIYHGYPGRPSDCCEAALREHKKAQEKLEPSKGPEKASMLRAFLEREFPVMTEEEHCNLLSKILQTMYSYDPGLGVNRPGKSS